MKGKKNEKKVEINDATVNSMGGKKCYMRNTYLSLYLDSNNVGDVYFSATNLIKWNLLKLILTEVIISSTFQQGYT